MFTQSFQPCCIIWAAGLTVLEFLLLNLCFYKSLSEMRWMNSYLKCGIFPACHYLYIQDVHKSPSQSQHLLQKQQNCISWNALELLTSPAGPYGNNLNLINLQIHQKQLYLLWLVHAWTLPVPTNSSISLYIIKVWQMNLVIWPIKCTIILCWIQSLKTYICHVSLSRANGWRRREFPELFLLHSSPSPHY